MGKKIKKRVGKAPKKPLHPVSQLFNPVDRLKLGTKDLKFKPPFKDTVDQEDKNELLKHSEEKISEAGNMYVKSKNKKEKKKKGEGKSKPVINETICHFGKETPLTRTDYESLADKAWLNDMAVEYGIEEAKRNMKDDISEVLFVPSWFYLQLTNKYLDNDPNDRREIKCKMYNTVKNWFKNSQIYDKKAMIFTICDNIHFLTLLALNIDSPSPLLVVLDSKPGLKIGRIAPQHIKDFIEEEIRVKRGLNINVNIVHPRNTPRQPGSHECGLYTIQFVQSILKTGVEDCLKLLVSGKLGESLEVMDSRSYRVKMASAIQRLSVEQGRVVSFPKLNLREVKIDNIN